MQFFFSERFGISSVYIIICRALRDLFGLHNHFVKFENGKSRFGVCSVSGFVRSMKLKNPDAAKFQHEKSRRRDARHGKNGT
jgi:hypothetical protein